MSRTYDLIKSAIKIHRKLQEKVPAFNNLLLKKVNEVYDQYDRRTPFIQFQKFSRNNLKSELKFSFSSLMKKNSSCSSFPKDKKTAAKTMTMKMAPILTPFQKYKLYQQRQKELIKSKALMNNSPQLYKSFIFKNSCEDKPIAQNKRAIHKTKTIGITTKQYSFGHILQQRDICLSQPKTCEFFHKESLNNCFKRTFSLLEIQSHVVNKQSRK